jgi:hypothetical protein
MARAHTGIRTAHSGAGGLPVSAPAIMRPGVGSTPSAAMASAWSHMSRIGFEKNQPLCGVQVEIQSFRARMPRATSP